MNGGKEQLILEFSAQTDFEKWLSKNFSSQEGIWVRFFKKDTGLQTFTYDEALDIALCYGWIDGQVKKYDEKSWIQKFTPRRKKSAWSQRNTENVARLIKEGRMKPSGLAEVERAKSDGRWEKAYASPANTAAPEDFLSYLSENKDAKAFWEKLNKSNKFAVIWQINSAKKSETRERRIKKFVDMLARGEKLY